MFSQEVLLCPHNPTRFMFICKRNLLLTSTFTLVQVVELGSYALRV